METNESINLLCDMLRPSKKIDTKVYCHIIVLLYDPIKIFHAQKSMMLSLF